MEEQNLETEEINGRQSKYPMNCTEIEKIASSMR